MTAMDQMIEAGEKALVDGLAKGGFYPCRDGAEAVLRAALPILADELSNAANANRAMGVACGGLCSDFLRARLAEIMEGG